MAVRPLIWKMMDANPSRWDLTGTMFRVIWEMMDANHPEHSSG